MSTRMVLNDGRGRALVGLVPDEKLWRIEWPDTGLSDVVNLTRAKDAARLWAERQVITEDRKTNAARRLKSLDNFSWSSSPVRNSRRAA
jgi:hypothetical protein